jgi:PIN domain nuclease of toxin-antitoxin system
MKQILDAHGLMVFLEKEPGFEKIESLFTSVQEEDDYLLMTSVNLGEVFYIIMIHQKKPSRWSEGPSEGPRAAGL